MNTNFPSFVVIGEQKCGTGWLRDRLSEHPSIYMPGSELNYFNNDLNYSKGLSWYLSNFNTRGAQFVYGEKSPNYFWQDSIGNVERTFLRIKRDLPKVKTILLLRSPVTRAISALSHHAAHVSRRINPYRVYSTPISDILFSDNVNESTHSSLYRGLYAERTKLAMDIFGDDLKVIVFETEIATKPESGLKKICDHLDLKDFNNFNYSSNRKEKKFSANAVRYSYSFPVLRKPILAVDRVISLGGGKARALVTEDCLLKLNNFYTEDVGVMEKLLKKPLKEVWLKD